LAGRDVRHRLGAYLRACHIQRVFVVDQSFQVLVMVGIVLDNPIIADSPVPVPRVRPFVLCGLANH
jgi:hypothetical protein